MKIEVLETFYGRPDESVEENTMFLVGAVVDVPDEFGGMVIEKGLAKIASPEHPAQKAKSHETE